MGDENEISDNVVGPERTFRQMFNLFIKPEVERRHAAGLLTMQFDLQKAQVIFDDDQPPKVRLNDEVKGSFLAKISKPVEIGDPISVSDITEVDRWELDMADADSGHFTVLRWGDGWRMLYDFQTNKRKAADLVSLAKQFLRPQNSHFPKAVPDPTLTTSSVAVSCWQKHA
jgi:hypothetical protein